MIFNLALVMLVLIVILIFACLVLPIKLKMKESRIIYLMFFVLLAVCAYFAEPSISDDLYRHYDQIDEIYNDNWYSNPSLITFRVMLTIISYIGYKGLLPTFTVLAFGYCGYEIMETNKEVFKNKKRNLSIYIILIFGFCSVFSVISGIRNALVAALWSYAFCVHFKKDRVRYYIIITVACFLHPAILYPTVLLFIYEKFETVLKRGWKMIYVVFTILPFTIAGIVELLASVPIGYVQLIARKIQYYQVGSLSYNMLGEKVYILQLLVLFVIVLQLKDSLEPKLRDFLMLYIYSLFTFSLIYPAIGIRMCMVLGFLSPKIIDASRHKKNRLLFNALVALCLFSGLFYTYSMIAHMRFNGIYFHDYIHL